MSGCLPESVSVPVKQVEGGEYTYFLAGLLWGFKEVTDKATDTWQTIVNHDVLSPLSPGNWPLISLWTLIWLQAVTVGLSQVGTPSQRVVSDLEEMSAGAHLVPAHISQSILSLFFTSPLRVTNPSIWQHRPQQGALAFPRSQGLCATEAAQDRTKALGKNRLLRGWGHYWAVLCTLYALSHLILTPSPWETWGKQNSDWLRKLDQKHPASKCRI